MALVDSPAGTQINYQLLSTIITVTCAKYKCLNNYKDINNSGMGNSKLLEDTFSKLITLAGHSNIVYTVYYIILL